MTAGDTGFPSYTDPEAAADRVIHLVGISAAAVSLAWLTASVVPLATVKQTVTLLIYGFGLLGMLTASAAYHLTRPSRLKVRLHHLDHAMIFVMIAGTYTPFALNALEPALGAPLCAAVWGLAAVGIGLNLCWYTGFQRVSLALYLGMGWLLLLVIRSLIAGLQAAVLVPLLAGGVVYSLGCVIHSCRRLPFHNAIWHAMVLTAAGLHLAAVSRLFAASS